MRIAEAKVVGLKCDVMLNKILAKFQFNSCIDGQLPLINSLPLNVRSTNLYICITRPCPETDLSRLSAHVPLFDAYTSPADWTASSNFAGESFHYLASRTSKKLSAAYPLSLHWVTVCLTVSPCTPRCREYQCDGPVSAMWLLLFDSLSACVQAHSSGWRVI